MKAPAPTRIRRPSSYFVECLVIATLGRDGWPIIAGATTPEIRAQRLRRVIERKRIADEFIPRMRFSGLRLTYGQMFVRLYGRRLDAAA